MRLRSILWSGLLSIWLAGSTPDGVRASEVPQLAGEHTIVAREPGYTLGWPANVGLAWRWGREILVGFTAGVHKYYHPGGHTFDQTKPYEAWFSRSLDGGKTWKLERRASHAFTVKPETLSFPPDQEPAELDRPINFAHPDFALLCLMEGTRTDGRAWIQYSYDRGRSWSQRAWLPLFGYDTVHARTDYLFKSKDECQLFLTGSHDRAGAIRSMEVFAVRTTDGGKTWRLESTIGTSARNMPSTVRLQGNRLVTAIRAASPIDPDKPMSARNREPFIEIHASDNDGKTWRHLNTHETWRKGTAEDKDGDHGTPPSLVQLQDGRLALTYARRGAYRICVKLSADGGRTWGPELVIRSGAGSWDIGYPRTTQRDDGKVVTVYYWTDGQRTERYIAATIWEVPPR